MNFSLDSVVESVTQSRPDFEDRPVHEEILQLKQQTGKDILVGSRSLIIQLLNSNLIDEFQICIHPVIEGKRLSMFDQVKGRTVLKILKTKRLHSGATVFYYRPKSKKTTNH